MMVGVGVDSVEVERFRMVLQRTPALLSRLFTEGERAYGESLVNPTPSLAARFAAKEATMKAMGVGLGAFAFQDVEVLKDPSGAPILALHGEAAALSARLGVSSWRLSLTHTCSVATALVFAE